jgi:hypothetical protein
MAKGRTSTGRLKKGYRLTKRGVVKVRAHKRRAPKRRRRSRR